MRFIQRLFYMVSLYLAALTSFSQYVKIDPARYFSASELEQANTAINEDYLTAEEKNIYLYTNLVRMYPKKFLELYIAYVKADGEESKLQSNRYYTSLTKELQFMDPVGPVLPDKAMFDLAECWAIESGEKGLVGHDRVNCPRGYAGENCGYGYDPTGQYYVMMLLIDEGIKSLGHRKNILLPGFKGLGAAIRDHVDYRYCAVQNFAYTNDVLREEAIVRERVQKEKEAEAKRLRLARLAEFDTAMARWSKEELGHADVNRASGYLSEMEKDIFLYLNLARLYPLKFKSLLWDQGPYFDQPLEANEQTIQKQGRYRNVSDWLALNRPLLSINLTQKVADMGHCVASRYLYKRGNPTGCISGFRSWRLQSFYSESAYHDAVNILLTTDDFQDLFIKNSTLIISKGDNIYVKVFLSN